MPSQIKKKPGLFEKWLITGKSRDTTNEQEASGTVREEGCAKSRWSLVERPREPTRI
jgi:hypothetical protein